MTGIGNPYKGSNSFSQITIGPKSKKSRPDEVGSKLNRLAGVREESKFVDAKKHNKMDKNAFLKLLANQLQNQDPLKPMDQKKFAADLAQFSQLEQLTNLNKKFDNQESSSTSEMRFMGASFIGKVAQTAGTSINITSESPANVNLPFYLDKPARKVMVRIFDKSNNMVGQLDLEGMGQGSQSVTWDKRMLDGTDALSGDYAFQVTAWDKDLNKFQGQTKSSGVVTGVSFENGETVLTVEGGKKVFLRDVNSFSQAQPKKQHTAVKNSALNKTQNNAYNKNTTSAIQ